MGWFLKLTKITTYKCDICGNKIGDSWGRGVLVGSTPSQSHLSLKYDLCMDCYRKIHK